MAADDPIRPGRFGKVGFGRVHGVRPVASTYITIRVEAQGIVGTGFVFSSPWRYTVLAPTARTCTVSFTDSEGIRHSVEVTASTL